MSKLSTRAKLILLVLIPGLIIIFLAANLIINNYDRFYNSLRLEKLVQFSIKTNNLIHELQKERGYSAAYLGSSDKEEFSLLLLDQRKNVDQQRQIFIDEVVDLNLGSFNDRSQTLIRNISTTILSIDNIREEVDKKSIAITEELNFYSNINADIFMLMKQILNLIQVEEIIHLLDAYINFSKIKEKSGIERAILANAFVQEHFHNTLHVRLVSLIAEQRMHAQEFVELASADHIKRYNQILLSEASQQVENYRQQALLNDPQVLSTVNSKEWFIIKTKQINLMKALENDIARDISALASFCKSKSNKVLISTLLMILIVGAVICFLVFKIISDIESFEQELVRSKNDLETTNDELRQFAYRTSHDLKAPLVSIESMVRLIELNLQDEKYDKLGKNVKVIGKKILQLKKFISDILNLTKASNSAPHEDEVNIDELVKEVSKDIFEPNIMVEFIYEPSHQQQNIKTSSVRLKQVLQNLLSNSVKYSNPQTKDPFVKLESSNDDKNLYLTITDNGLGFPKDSHDKVFSMFCRLHKKSVEGSGLGLYLVKKHIEKMGGDISFESTEGLGSVFKLMIPYL